MSSKLENILNSYTSGNLQKVLPYKVLIERAERQFKDLMLGLIQEAYDGVDSGRTDELNKLLVEKVEEL